MASWAFWRGTDFAEEALVTHLGLLLGVWLTTGCTGSAQGAPEASTGDAGAAGAAPQVVASVELGVPGGDDGLDFVPLEDGAELRLQTFGQGGTHVLTAVRCIGFGRRAFVSASLRNLDTGLEVTEPAPARPQLLYCSGGDEGSCDLVPYLVHASGLTETDQERDGLRVELRAHVRNEAGADAEGSREVVLSTADL
jgi:hypothetical protein